MTYHQHVDVLVHCVARKRHCRIRRGWQDVRQSADADNIRRMTTAGAFGVIGMDGPILESGNRIFDEPRLIERVRVDGDLYIKLVGDAQALVDSSRRRSPVLMKLQSESA